MMQDRKTAIRWAHNPGLRVQFPVLLLLALFFGCAHNDEVHLPDYTGDAFRAIVQHDAVTVSDRLTIYGPGATDERIKCHERFHREAQARVMGDAAVESGAIRDTVIDRALYWVLVYSVEYSRDGYDNRFEEAARKACP